MSKKTRAEEAREQALRLRAEQERAARRQRVLAITLTVVGLAVVGGLVAFILSQQAPAPRDFSDVEDPLSEVTAPATATDEGGIPVGADGAAGGSDPDAVPVTVYLDFMCPACGAFEQQAGPVLDEMRENGEILVEYRPVAILDGQSRGTRFSTRAGAAAGLVADQSPEAFADFVAAMYANQPQEGTEGLSDEQIAEIARQAGVSEDVASTIADGGHMTGPFADWVSALTVVALREQAPFGTPTVLVDGERLDSWAPEQIQAAVAEAQG